MGTMLLALALASVAGADDLKARADELASLRAELAALQDDLAESQDALALHLRALDGQRVELEVQARRESLRRDRLIDELTVIRERAAEDADLEGRVRPTFDAGLDVLRGVVTEGLPFRVDERLAALDTLEDQVRKGELSPSRAVGRLWAFVEDELRLGRENVLDRQVVALSDGEVLAEVARLGAAALYFRAPDGRVGHLVRGPDGAWTPVVLEGTDAAHQVGVLLDSLRKGIRTGWFELPWAFAEVPR